MRALAVTWLLGACSSPHEIAPAPTTARRDAAAVPSFARDIAPLLEKHCTGTECHGEDPPIDVTLDLRPAAAYRQLVRVPAEMGEAHLLRVNPGDPDASMLVHKRASRHARDAETVRVDVMAATYSARVFARCDSGCHQDRSL